MKDQFSERLGKFPPHVVGSITDWEAWNEVNEVTSMPVCGVVELRVDALMAKDSEREILQSHCPRPLLLTLRHHSEGGLVQLDERERQKRVMNLMSMAQGLDWEIRQLEGAEALLNAARNAGLILVASWHDFQQTPTLEELLKWERYAREKGADIVKFAFRLHDEKDMLVGCELLKRASGPIAVMGMGPLGPTSRLLYSQMGSCLIYGYLGSMASAPGQWPAQLCTEALSHLVTARP